MATTCPRCGFVSNADTACPRCGVIFAKLRAPAPPRRVPVQAARLEPPPRAPRQWRATLALLCTLGLGLTVFVFRDRLSPPPAQVRSPAPPSPQPSPLASATRRAPSTSPSFDGAALAARIDREEHRRANDLVDKLNSGQALQDADVNEAEALLARHPSEAALRDVLRAVLLRRAEQLLGSRQTAAEATRLLRRAAALDPADARPHLALLQLFLEQPDWAAAEEEARTILARDPRNAKALEGLGYALLRQGRDSEAAEALEAALSAGDSERARTLLAEVQRGMRNERGMKEQRLSHFSVRYDGEAHEDVGREVVHALERHYAALTLTFDHEVSAPIPVILFSRTSYYEATDAPRWSGGQYTDHDGRIRVPIGGLAPGLTAQLDSTLIHELTHAFIADITHGHAPRDLHEGLAQYMEGERLEERMPEDALRALADGRIGGVQGFYLNALAFAEYLVEMRGQSGINDLLRQMGESGDVDGAFREVYGADHAGMQEAALARLRQRHGS